jgi:hypothetical protein
MLLCLPVWTPKRPVCTLSRLKHPALSRNPFALLLVMIVRVSGMLLVARMSRIHGLLGFVVTFPFPPGAGSGGGGGCVQGSPRPLLDMFLE